MAVDWLEKASLVDFGARVRGIVYLAAWALKVFSEENRVVSMIMWFFIRVP